MINLDDIVRNYASQAESIRKSMELFSKSYTENLSKTLESLNNSYAKEAIASFNSAFVNLNEINRISKIASKNMEIVEIINSNLRPLAEMQEIFKPNLSYLSKNVQQINRIVENFRVPSLIAENMSASLRAVTESFAYPDRIVEFSVNKIPVKDRDRLNILLSKIDPYYIEMRKSAWEALNSNDIEKLRHSLVSMRELIYQILKDLAPDSVFTTSPVTIRMRVMYIVSSKSDTKLIESIINIAENLCSCLSKLHAKIHKIENFNFNVKLYLQTADLLLFLILSKTNL